MKTILIAMFAITPGSTVPVVSGVYCEMVSSRAVDNSKLVERTKVWQKSETQFRVEQTIGAKTMVTIANGRDVWVIDMDTKRGVHSLETLDRVRGVAKQQVLGPDLIAAFRKSGGKPVGTAGIEGTQTRIYRRTAKPWSYHIYVVEGKSPRIRRMTIEGITHAAAKAGADMKTHIMKSQTDVPVYRVDGPMDDALFHPPVGITMSEKPKK